MPRSDCVIEYFHRKWLVITFSLELLVILSRLWIEVPIIFSPETTYITEPLAEDGLPNYYQYVLEQAKEGIRPEENAAVLLWQAFGVEPVPDGLREEFFRQLEMDAPSNSAIKYLELNDESLSSFGAALQQRLKASAWTTGDFPEVAEWLNSNQRPLDLMVEASKKSDYFSPLVSGGTLEGRNPRLVECLMLTEQRVREASWALSVRAMRNLGETRPMEALEDVLTEHRLARLVGKQSPPIAKVCAFAIDLQANKCLLEILDLAEFSEDQVHDILEHVDGLKEWNLSKEALEFERLLALDMVVQSRRHGINAFTDQEITNSVWDRISWMLIDLNVALRDINNLFDEAERVVSFPSRERRIDEYRQFDAQIIQRVKQREGKKRYIGFIALKDKSQAISNFLLGLLAPALEPLLNAQDRANATLQLTKLAVALEVYSAEYGAYPDELAQLVPAVLEEIPRDLYSEEPFRYEKKPEGYLLYSVYENGVDDRGTDRSGQIVRGEWVEDPVEIAENQADLVIRMPMEKPEMAAMDAENSEN